MRQFLLLGAAAVFVAALGGCNCGTTLNKRFPEINADPLRVDFGTVQVGVTHQQQVRIYNSGAAPLTLSELRTAPPFAVVEAAPVTVQPGTEANLTIAFAPQSPDKRYTGTLVILSDDPEQNELTIDLAGIGVSAQATANPDPIAFGDVWVGEQKTLPVTIHNAGSNELTVLKAEFLDGTTAEIAGDLSPIGRNIPGGGDAVTNITFKPTQLSETIPGGIRLQLDANQGGELVIPFQGRGIRAVPRVCFKFDDSAIETCTDANAGNGFGGNLEVQFPPLCDRSVSPPDAGTTDVICGGAPYQKSGQFYVRNEGNVAVKYSMKYVATTGKTCDGGTPTQSDFRFSNQPDGGTTWTEATAQLPASVTDPRQWETGHVTVTYAPTSQCSEEAADQARIEWTRQGDTTRQPVNLFTFVSGQSKLPFAVPHGLSVTGVAPSQLDFYGADNRGNAAFQIQSVKLFEVVTGIFEGGCDGLDAGVFQDCELSSGALLNDCAQFAWAAGGDPNVGAPHTVPPSDGGVPVAVQVGTVVFGLDETNPPVINRRYCVYSVVQTSDPYHPTVISKIEARKTQ